MKIRTFTVCEFHFTEPEREILETASKLILGVIEEMEQNEIGEYRNFNIGKIFNLKDLYRMRIIINTLINKEPWMGKK